MADEKTYHHGDLRAALLVAAEAELTERGVEAFSLRQVAKRAGVSHAAPAHHFGDTSGLLTALAAEGYRRFVAAQTARESAAAPDPKAQLLAAGLGYVDFALQTPTLFRLMFASDRPNYADPELSAAGEAAYDHLHAQVLAIGGTSDDVPAIWAITHGVADLLVSGRLKHMQGMTDAQRDARLVHIFLQNMPLARA